MCTDVGPPQFLRSTAGVENGPSKEMIMSIHLASLTKFAAIAVLAGATSMQGAQQGTFHLPMEAHWGSALLQPGDYRIELPTVGTQVITQFLIVDSNGKGVFEVPTYAEQKSVSDRSWLTLTNVDGEYVVSEYSSGSSGKRYAFPVPNALRRHLTTKSAENTLALMVR
jgi:hypothetical protein